MLVTEFLNNNGIKWGYILLNQSKNKELQIKWLNGETYKSTDFDKNINYIDSQTLTDEEEQIILKKYDKMKSDISKYKNNTVYIAYSLDKFSVIDVDDYTLFSEKLGDKNLDLLLCLNKSIQYKSRTKRLPHYLVKFDGDINKKRYNFDGSDILIKGSVWVRINEEIIFQDSDTPCININQFVESVPSNNLIQNNDSVFDFEKMDSLLTIINKTHFDNFGDWIKIGLCLKGLYGDDSFTLFDKHSKRSKKYDDTQIQYQWNGFNSGNDKSHIGILCNMAKSSNLNKFRKWQAKYSNDDIDCDIEIENDYFEWFNEAGEMDYIQQFYDNNKNTNILKNLVYVYHSHQSKYWYFANHFNIYDKIDVLPPCIFESFCKYTIEKFRKNLNMIDVKHKEYKTYKKMFSSFIKKIRSIEFNRKFHSKFPDCFYDINGNIEFEDSLDTNQRLICFKDGICFDFDINDYRKIELSDNIATTLHYNKPTPNKQIQQFIYDKFLSELFESEDKCVFLLDVLGYALFTNRFQNMYMLTGEGANGKTLLFNLISKCLEQYIKHADSKFLTTELDAGKPDETLYACNKKKLCLLSEPAKDKYTHSIKWNFDKIKLTTGDDIVTARPMYGHSKDFKMTATQLCACNSPPELPDNIDYAIKRRFKTLYFPYSFVNGKITDPNTQKKADLSLMDKFKQPQYYQQFLLLLIEHIGPKINKPLVVPELVVQYTNEYINDNDDVQQFINLFESSNERITRHDLYNMFIERFSSSSITKTQLYKKFRLAGFKEYRTSISRGFKIRLKKYNMIDESDDDDEIDDLDTFESI